MNLFFVIDEYTDVEDAEAVQGMVGIVIDAINNPEMSRPPSEVLLGELSRQCVCLHCTYSSRQFTLCDKVLGPGNTEMHRHSTEAFRGRIYRLPQLDI